MSRKVPKDRRSYSRHGLSVLKVAVKVRGLHCLDRRTAAARGLMRWREELLADLGGEENVSAQQLAIVEQVTRLRLYCDTLDAYLVEQAGGLVNRRRRTALPVLLQRAQLGDSLLRHLQALGLERRVRPLPALRAYLEQRERPEETRSDPEPKDGTATPPVAKDEPAVKPSAGSDGVA